MHPILAENLDGWLFGALLLFGGIIASVLALCALVPARRRNRRLTFILVAPAFLIVVLVTGMMIYAFITDGLHNPDYSFSDFAIPWLMLGGPSFATGLLALAVLRHRMRTPRQSAPDSPA
jgi:hypothetical protein